MANHAAWARYYHNRLRWAVVPIAAGTKHPRTTWQEDCRRARPLSAPPAAAHALDLLTRDPDVGDTRWMVYDRHTTQMHMFTQHEFDNLCGW